MANSTPLTPEAEDDVMKAVEAAEAADRTKPRHDPAVIEDAVEVAPDAPPAAALRPEAPEAVKPAPPPPPPPAKPSAKSSGGGFLPMALGGVVAAAAGYALSILVPFPAAGPAETAAFAPASAVAALEDRLAALEAAAQAGPALADRVSLLEQRPEPASPPDLGPLTSALAEVQARITAVEQRGPAAPGLAPSAEVTASLAALQAEVAQLRSAGPDASAELQKIAAETAAQLTEAQDRAAALTAEAESVAAKLRSSAALDRIQAALDSGAPFASALQDLPGLEIPAVLSGAAQAGVPTLAAVTDSFAPAARAALEASLRATVGSSWMDRVSSFLRTTTGARSLTPREGTDPDAVLSRAEAALRANDLPLALTELQGLPPEGLAAMQGWIAQAQQRIDALAAAEALTAAVEG